MHSQVSKFCKADFRASQRQDFNVLFCQFPILDFKLGLILRPGEGSGLSIYDISGTCHLHWGRILSGTQIFGSKSDQDSDF